MYELQGSMCIYIFLFYIHVFSHSYHIIINLRIGERDVYEDEKKYE